MKVIFVVLVLMVNRIATEESALTYTGALIASYSSTNSSLSREEFQSLFDSFRLEIWESMEGGVDDPRDDDLCDRVIKQGSSIGCSNCMELDIVFARYAVNAQLNSSALLKALPAVVLALKHEQCQYRATHNETFDDMYNPRKPTTYEVWGYSVGVVLLVCLISNLGAFLAPMMDSLFFKKVLNFLVAVAIGTQAGAGILVLLPESLHLMHIAETADTYLWKVTAAIGGILFVLVLERILKIAFHKRKTAKERLVAELTIETESTVTMTPVDSTNNLQDYEKTSNFIANLQKKTSSTVDENGVVCFSETDNNGNDATKINGFDVLSFNESDYTKVELPKQEIATIAWMVLLGDGIHKFVDGLSVGAAFTETFSTGLTLTISIICEEIPHELGDISILLHSGMTMKQALFYNTLSAACGIPGVIAGILLGGTPSSNQWIFAVSAGIFIYVPLAAMLPEMSLVFEKSLKDGSGAIFLCVLQLLGLCLGFGIIVLVAYYAKLFHI